MSTTPLPAVGKARVGAPPPPPSGKTGITIALALFFDGTLNNRSNTNKRIATRDTIIDDKEKDGRSSYGGFYSNVAVMEYLNLKRDKAKKQVSVYIEGIGTVDYTENEEKAGKPRAAISNDDQDGFAFGTGPTGIWDRVTKGFNEARKQIIAPGFYDHATERIAKIEVDVVGFSRGAAGARHFVHRRAALQQGWEGGEHPEVVINFVGLYDTVSSFEKKGSTAGNAVSKLTEGSFDRGIFEDDVKELGLDMHGVPKRVVHLTAADEYRSNFSLTNIITSLRAGVGFELQLPGAHSDVGGGYVEPDPHNPTMDPKLKIRPLNREVRRVAPDDRQLLVAQGWYRPEQFVRWHLTDAPLIESHKIPWLGTTPAIQPYWDWNGVRYLTNQYQYVALFVMLDFAQHGAGRPGGKAHTAMAFESLDLPDNNRYRVPADLVPLRDAVLREAVRLSGSQRPERVELLKDKAQANTLRWLRNRYLHRSAHTLSEGKAWLGMDGTTDKQRVVIPDDVLRDSFRTEVADKARRKAEAAKQSIRHTLDEWRQKIF